MVGRIRDAGTGLVGAYVLIAILALILAYVVLSDGGGEVVVQQSPGAQPSTFQRPQGDWGQLQLKQCIQDAERAAALDGVPAYIGHCY